MTTLDFDLHGFFRLRLLDATERERKIVQRQIGPLDAPAAGEPDLTVQFVDALPDDAEMRFIGLNDAAYTGDAFYILKGKNKTRVKVEIPFDQVGDRMTIRAERGLNSIPLLIALININLISKGILPFHASGFTYNGKGALVTGWAKGGKTETLLSFMAQGAKYVGDEWVYLLEDGRRMFGIPEPMRVWSWHLDSLPAYRARLKRKDRARLTSLSVLSRSLGWMGGPGQVGALARRVQPVVNRQMFTHFAPHKLFGEASVQASSPVDLVILAVSRNAPEITVTPAGPEEVAERMLYSLFEEQEVLSSAYRKFRYAFPQRCNAWIDNLERIQHKHLLRALQGKPAYVVAHPYPVAIPRLHEALLPLFSS